MPEIAEVEHARREAEHWASGQLIVSVPRAAAPRWDSMRGSRGALIGPVRRRGKYLLMDLAGGSGMQVAVLHLGMSGGLRAGDGTFPEQDASRHVRLSLQMEDRWLGLEDPRGFGFARLTTHQALTCPPWSETTLGRLGADPLRDDWDEQAAGNALAKATRGKSAKAALLEQRAIAGVGNYLADEALHRAGISPHARHLDQEAGALLARQVRIVAQEALQRGGVSIRDYAHADGSAGQYGQQLRAYGRAGLPCLECGHPLRKETVAGRGTTWCPQCQD